MVPPMPRIMTYNVHRCVGTDRQLDVERIAAVIADCCADIVCLQELDVRRARTGHVDQAHAIASLLGMNVDFYAAMQVEEELYGDAILTALPQRRLKGAALPTLGGVPGLEPRGALWLEVSLGQARLQVINTHLGLLPGEQHRQVKALAGPKWLGNPRCQDPTILIGDFNFTSVTGPYRYLAQHLRDAQRVAGLDRSVKTFPSAFPTIRIDHCFVSRGITIRRVHAPFHPLARLASDHLPLVFDFDLTTGEDPDAGEGLSR